MLPALLELLLLLVCIWVMQEGPQQQQQGRQPRLGVLRPACLRMMAGGTCWLIEAQDGELALLQSTAVRQNTQSSVIHTSNVTSRGYRPFACSCMQPCSPRGVAACCIGLQACVACCLHSMFATAAITLVSTRLAFVTGQQRHRTMSWLLLSLSGSARMLPGMAGICLMLPLPICVCCCHSDPNQTNN
jgi:hypothetical protein